MARLAVSPAPSPSQAALPLRLSPNHNRSGLASASHSSLSSNASTKSKVNDELRSFHDRLASFQDDYDRAIQYCNDILTVYQGNKAKIFLEMADLSKKEGRLVAAKKYFKQASLHHPDCEKVWLEWAKLEEEAGNYLKAKKIVDRGLGNNPLVEGLALRGIKLAERNGDHRGVRNILGLVRSWDSDKSWKAMSEGASFEAKLGNIQLARQVFALILKKCGNHGPAYIEAIKLEQKCHDIPRAIALAKEGMDRVPRFGPIWVSALQLYQISNVPIDEMRVFVREAIQFVPNDVRWKFWFELGKMENEKSGMVQEYQKCCQAAVKCCPPQQIWKIWLGAARIELMSLQASNTRKLLERALVIVPRRSKAIVLLETARTEEFEGRIDAAQEVLARGKAEFKGEWKLFLESILVDYRASRFHDAIQKAEAAIEIHSGTGRLWAMLIALSQFRGVEAQEKLFRTATVEVAKSGEVWCEGARLRMNPLSPYFNLVEARRFLDFAIQFTPQYGDSFVEYIRLELLCNGPTRFIDSLKQYCMHVAPNYGSLWSACMDNENTNPAEVLTEATRLIQADLYTYRSVYAHAILRSNAQYKRPKYAGEAHVVRTPMRDLPSGVANKTCQLCHMPIKSSDVVVLACTHLFHKDCGRAYSTRGILDERALGESNQEDKLCGVCGQPWVVVKFFSSEQSSSRSSLARYSLPELKQSRSMSRHNSDSSISGELDPWKCVFIVGEGLRTLFSNVRLAGDTPRAHTRLRTRNACAVSLNMDALGFIVNPLCKPHDFVTGLMQLNRDSLQVRSLAMTQRARILFGSDSVTI